MTDRLWYRCRFDRGEGETIGNKAKLKYTD